MFAWVINICRGVCRRLRLDSSNVTFAPIGGSRFSGHMFERLWAPTVPRKQISKAPLGQRVNCDSDQSVDAIFRGNLICGRVGRGINNATELSELPVTIDLAAWRTLTGRPCPDHCSRFLSRIDQTLLVNNRITRSVIQYYS